MAMERIFSSFKDSGGNNDSAGAYDPSDPESYKSFIQAMIRDARDYEGSVLAAKRNTAQEFYYGYLPSMNADASPYSDTMIVTDPNATYEQVLGGTHEDANRSTYVSTDVRDAIMLMLPGLIRLFGASESPVFLVPRSQQEVDLAQQATDYVNYVFWCDNPGFLILYGALKDALTVRTGFVKWWTDENKETVRKRFTHVTAEQLQGLMLENPTAKIVHLGAPIPSGMPTAADPECPLLGRRPRRLRG